MCVCVGDRDRETLVFWRGLGSFFKDREAVQNGRSRIAGRLSARKEISHRLHPFGNDDAGQSGGGRPIRIAGLDREFEAGRQSALYGCVLTSVTQLSGVPEEK